MYCFTPGPPLAGVAADVIVGDARQLAARDDLGLRIPAHEVHVNRGSHVFALRPRRLGCLSSGCLDSGCRGFGESVLASGCTGRPRGRLQRENRVIRREEYGVAVAPRRVLYLRIGLTLVGFKRQRKSAQTLADPALFLRAERWRRSLCRCNLCRGTLHGSGACTMRTQAGGACDSEGGQSGYCKNPDRRHELS